MAAEPAARQTEPVVVLTTADRSERPIRSDDPGVSSQQIGHHVLRGSTWTPVETSIVLPVPARGAFRWHGLPRRPTR